MSVKIKEISNVELVLSDSNLTNQIIKDIKNGEVYILRNAFESVVISQLKQYLTGVGRNSLPNYSAIYNNAPNGHLINIWDPRSTVGACFHQFNFYPWNFDIFDLFERTKMIYKLKNVISGKKQEQYMDKFPEDNFTRRLAFQFYPSGIGGLKKHADPVGEHQLVVPTMNLTTKGIDFSSGGAYIELSGKKIYTDEIAPPGDVLFFNAQMPHGVDVIDEGKQPDWYSFNGRWMLLFALNSLDPNSMNSKAKQIG